MSDLAFNINGEPFEVPATASGWRVRRMKLKGPPEVVYGRDGLPLVLPLDAELDDLKREVDVEGRYRVDPVDDATKPIVGATSGYVHVNNLSVAPVASPSPQLTSDNIVVEAMRMNSELARTIIDRFPQMMESAATLLRAADGAGLPAREPRGLVEGDTDDDEDEDDAPQAPAGFDLNALVAQVVPLIVMSLGKGKLKIPGLGEVLDWRKASPKQITEEPKDAPRAAGEAKPVEIPPLDPATMAHFIAVQSALKPEEAALAREVASTLGPAELRGWVDELSKLSVPQAVQKIRVLIAGNTEAVS